ncbi:MAG TPA: gluconate 2-dehydrogenase subunit 3 family protein [Caulobacteraceae bacterium]|nr:gluconate 2-dehydrogenase subunit 3 family protein [Caulobacteraceae bacterium]
MSERPISRRRMLAAGAVLSASGVTGAIADDLTGNGVPFKPNSATFPQAADISGGYNFFSQAEAAFIEAACARMIPKDDLGPGAVEAGVPIFLDRQLGGEFGAGARWYMNGPWPKGEKTQGYQSRFTPAQMYRAAIKDIDDACAHAHNAPFHQIAADQQDAFLKGLESGSTSLPNADSKAVFTMFLQNVIEGFFSDPIYGGNRDMAGWKLIGFSGARYDQRPYVLAYNKPYPLPPVGISGRPGWTREG